MLRADHCISVYLILSATRTLDLIHVYLSYPFDWLAGWLAGSIIPSSIYFAYSPEAFDG